MDAPHLLRVRTIALALPEANERLSHGAPSFFFRDKKPICYFHDRDFAADGRVSLWCRATAGVQQELTSADPTRYFAPTPSASGVFRDWVAVYLDEPLDDEGWNDVRELIVGAYRLVAPKKLIAELENG